MDIIRDWSIATEESLWKKSKLCSLVDHKGLIGYTREGQFKELLSNFLPNTVNVGTGEIIDHRGNKSKQMDVVLSRGNSCRLPVSEDVSIYPVESVLATVEIKTSLSKKTLKEAVSNQSSGDYKLAVFVPEIRTKDQIASGEMLTEEDMEQYPVAILCHSTYVYFFNSEFSDPLEILSKKITEISKETDINLQGFPSVIAAPGVVFLKNDGILFPKDTFSLPVEDSASLPWLYAYREESHPLYWILAHLMIRLSYTSGGPSAPGLSANYDLTPYLEFPKTNWNVVFQNIYSRCK